MSVFLSPPLYREDSPPMAEPMHAVVTTVGGRPYQEDRHYVGELGDSLVMVAVFDGHGGEAVAEHCARTMPSVLLRMPGVEVEHLARAFVHVDDTATGAAHVGCTACVVLMDKTHIWCANTGDSRAVLATDGGAVPLSRDHKPENVDERKRIEGQGGNVVHDGYCYRVQGVLNVSRVIGDWALRPYVTPLPEVARTIRGAGDRYVIVASDGLWDVFSSAEAVQAVDASLAAMTTTVPARKRAESALRALVAEARRRGSSDNITVALRGCSIHGA